MRQNQYITILLLILAVILSACDTNTSDTTVGPVPTLTKVEVTRRATPMKVCTPPPCPEDETYHCPDECPGGCGLACATRTPAPGDVSSADTSREEAQVITLTTVQDFPDPSEYSWQPWIDGLDKPLAVITSGDGSGRLFILEQPGRIRIAMDTELLDDSFLDITGQVVDRGNEQGLLGLAFHPEFSENGTFFINYTGSGGDTFISRFHVGEDPNIADKDSEEILLRIKQPYVNHNGGHLLFGPDGNLYIGTGDGGSAGDPEGNAQNPGSLLGKMLRINVDHGNPYAIPSDNPYVKGGGLPEIWALGLRNPWRYTFDRETGDLYIADVGQNLWEEIHYLAVESKGIPTGSMNFGWDYFEGTHPYEGSAPEGTSFILPIWEYDHSMGCSVTGGPVYRGMMPEWQGIYFYGDFCTGVVWGLLQDPSGVWKNMILYETGSTITSFGEDEYGEIYLVDRGGTIYRFAASQ